MVTQIARWGRYVASGALVADRSALATVSLQWVSGAGLRAHMPGWMECDLAGCGRAEPEARASHAGGFLWTLNPGTRKGPAGRRDPEEGGEPTPPVTQLGTAGALGLNPTGVLRGATWDVSEKWPRGRSCGHVSAGSPFPCSRVAQGANSLHFPVAHRQLQSHRCGDLGLRHPRRPKAES